MDYYMAHYGDMKLYRKDEELVRAFYRHIPITYKGEEKKSIGPVEIRKNLKHSGIEIDPKFDFCKKYLLDHRLIGVKPGGGVYRQPRGKQGEKYPEKYYYEPIRRELELYWARQPKRAYHLRHRFLRVLDTSTGRKEGKWTSPDLTLLGGKVLPYLPGRYLDVITFEVKVGMPVVGLYEALAHRRRANYAYLVCVVPEETRGKLAPLDEAVIVVEATRQGVGVILVSQEDDFHLWQELVEPIRHEPDPQQLHDFLENQCDRGDCLKGLREWLGMDERKELPPVTEEAVRAAWLDLTTEEFEVALKIVKRLGDGDGA